MIKLIIKLYLWAENLWFTFPEKLRFLLVGGFNTVLAWSILATLDWSFGKINAAADWNLPSIWVANAALIVQYIITINISFMTMRYYVFRSHGNIFKEWIKAWSVYIFIYLINAPSMSFLMWLFNLKAWQAQGIYLVFSTIITFILHKYYSFRQEKA
ncbi:MAG: GtrA family protein [Alphaproteobacteria bacterium]|nr:GtrA family protein [Alphaproteobacteria bacterium]